MQSTILISTKTGVSSAFESRDVNDPIIKHLYVQTLSELRCKTKYLSKEYIFKHSLRL